jgi:hypothetical protein
MDELHQSHFALSAWQRVGVETALPPAQTTEAEGWGSIPKFGWLLSSMPPLTWLAIIHPCSPDQN